MRCAGGADPIPIRPDSLRPGRRAEREAENHSVFNTTYFVAGPLAAPAASPTREHHHRQDS
ncbi:hypothetical protein CBM2634_A10199 [Cupriavidus taiwanensis]|uniref:Uncharacterized protein n=1 Tax=Cupriavidus taiwanensis TaxID=164546 RepID=A0A375IY16_9BURK|nr:hypothetical protein CBM2634_A10199 [Cupriavidus taiwanensis]